VSRSGTAANNSIAYDATPRTNRGWNDGKKWQPRSLASDRACSSAAWKSWPCSTSSAPYAHIAALFDALLPKGTTIVAFSPRRRAAYATLWP
jgi:hypothetical protein